MGTFSLKNTSITSCEEFKGALFLFLALWMDKNLLLRLNALKENAQRFIYGLPINYLWMLILFPSIINPFLP
jgi:hypothetical protein